MKNRQFNHNQQSQPDTSTTQQTLLLEQNKTVPHSLTRKALRQQLRQQRLQLTAKQQHDASEQLLTQFIALNEIQTAQHIAIYHSHEGEIDTRPIIHWLWQQGKQTYLPIPHPFSKGHLLYQHYHQQTRMKVGKYGILQPILNKNSIIPTQQLDLICTPLVAFDQYGQRLGMGGGYYDRTLSSWFKERRGATPIGLAHQCQYVELLSCEEWDIPLPIILTPTRTWRWPQTNQL